MIGGSMNQDNMLINMNCIYELEEKDYFKFLHGIEGSNLEVFFSNVPQKERQEARNKIYLALLSYCLTALKFLQDNSGKYFEVDKTGVLIKNKNKLTRFIDVLEEYIFIDYETEVYNERWFNKIIYNEMDLVLKTNTSITLISLQLEYPNKTTPTLDVELEKETNLSNVKTFVTIVKKNLTNERDQLFCMNANEFLIVSKEQETDHINTIIEYLIKEAIESLKNIYVHFGITRITREQLKEDFNIITYLKNVDQEVVQCRLNYLKKQNSI